MIVGITIFMLCVQYFFPVVQSLANEAVDVSVIPSPDIDIVLAKSKTKVDVSSFEEDLKKELIKQGISPDRVKINAVEAVEANIQDSFTWETDVASSIGSIQITNQGQDIVMKGNKKNPGKNAIWMIPEKEQEQEIQFDYSVDFGDSFNAAGMLLRVKQTGDTLTGYMLSLNKSNKTWYSTAGKKYGAIWKFTYKIGTNSTNMTKTFVQGLDIKTSGTLNIKSTDMEIIISGGGLKTPVKYTMDTEYGYGFGFFSDHYSHNCSKIGAFTLGNIKLKTMTVKKFKEVLSNPEWREDSVRVLVNVDDTKNEELEDKNSLATIQSGLMNEEIHPIFWGTDKNEEQSKKVIEGNDGKGTFIDNTDYEKAIEETVKYIKSLLEKSETSQYALVGENVDLKVTPESAKTNTITPEYPNGKWKVNHDYEYFENDLGQFENNGKYMSDLTLDFDKTGRYELLYEDGSTISKYVYVHRKPVANFNVAQTGSNVTLTSTSYDLDSYSKNNGIAEEKWQYKKVGESTWTPGKLANIEPDEVYMIQLKVKDFQETWSSPATKYVTYSADSTDSTPIANFMIKNSTASKYEELQIEDGSYDPAGLAIVSHVWNVKKDGKVLYTGENPLTKYNDYEPGTYTMSLVVTNEAGKSSEEYSRIFYLTGDTIAPEVVVTPEKADWTNQAVKVDLKCTDKGGSGINGYQYLITDSKETPTSWSELILKANDTITIDTEGEKYLHVIAHDNAGNVSKDNVFGPYKIDLIKPEIDSIVPENKDWTNESIDISVTFSDKGGSGFSGYKYALTTEKTTPDAWSEIVKEDKAKFTISGEAEYYLHLISYDNAGNASDEAVYGPYQVDKTSPEVEVTPSFADWTNQPVTVNVKWSDKGGSNLQKYKYAVTNSGIMPEEWKNEVVGEPKPIVIDTEGENYLHIAGCDNAGNESVDNIFGKYKLDFTLPELMGEDKVNSGTNVTSIQFTAKDEMSGISKFVVNGVEVSGTEYIATNNGDYHFEITDYAGNVLTKSLSIHNIEKPVAKVYTITYYYCEGVENPNPVQYTAEGEKITLQPVKKDGFLFKGWYTDKDFKNKVTQINPEMAKNVELFALWDEILYVKSDVYPVKEEEKIPSFYDVPEGTTVIEFLENIETNATITEVYSPEDVKLGDDKLVEEGSSLVAQKGEQQKEYKIYLKKNKEEIPPKEELKEDENKKDELPKDESFKEEPKQDESQRVNTNQNNTTKNDNQNNSTSGSKAIISRVSKEKFPSILPYTGRRYRMDLLLGACIILILKILFASVLKPKGKH